MTTTELRPLTLGELLDRTFSYYRGHFLLFVGIMAIPHVFLVALDLLVQAFRHANFTPPTSPDPAATMTRISAMLVASAGDAIAIFVSYFVFYTIALGATTYALSEVHLGRTTTIRGAYGKLRGKIGRLFGLMALIMLILVGTYILVFVSAVALGLMGGLFLRTIAGPRSLLLGLGIGVLAVLGIIAALAAPLMFLLRYGVAVPALVLENISAKQALKRSALLTKGCKGRIFVIGFLMWLISLVVAAILQGPFWVAALVLGFKFSVMPFWLQASMAVTGGVGGAISGPLLVIALALLYYDTRVRNEGFDLQLMMDSLDQGSPAVEGSADPLSGSAA